MKIKVLIIIPLLTFILGKSTAQTDTLLMKELTKPVINCELIAVNSQRIITSLDINQTDSIRKILNAWETFCGENEPILRMKILLDISEKKDISENFEKYVTSGNWQSYIGSYRYRFYNKEPEYEIYPYNNYVPNGGKYDEMTKHFAELLLPHQLEDSYSYLFCEFITGNFDKYNEDIRTEKFTDDEIIKKAYGKHIVTDYTGKLFSGIWIPQGHLASHFGENFLIGFSAATPKFFKNNFLAEINLSARIPFNKPDFVFTADDSVYTADNDAGFNFGANIIYEKKIFDKTFLRFYSGIGVDWLSTDIRTLETRDKSNEEASYYYITTFSVPAGVGIRRNIFTRKTIGIDLSYNYTPYNLDGKLISDLNGNNITANLFFGL